MAKQRDDTAKPRDEAQKPAGTTHRWAIDQLEEGTAAVEQDGDHVYELPRWLLPATAHEGDVLAAELTTSADGAVTFTVRVDPAATAAAKTPKRAKPPRSPKDPGGDISL